MLSKADDFPIHQTPEPIAYAGTDRNFYDRYFFNGYNPDGSGFFAVAFGTYPHLNVVDAHVSLIRNDVEYCVHASRILNMERFDLEVGPIRIEVVEPLQRLRVTLTPTDGLAAELTFDGRAFPIEEPRFIRRNGPRTFMDYTRLTQNGRYTGWIEIDGKRETLAPGCVGTRDRSWGVRPVGAPDSQPTPNTAPPGFFWQWTPMNFADKSVFFHFTADSSGVPWNTRAVIAPDGASTSELIEVEHADMAVVLQEGTRHAKTATLTVPLPNQPDVRIEFTPVQTFLMRGIGYTHPKWGHGRLHGELAFEREDIGLKDLNLASMENLHIQALSKLTLRQDGRPDQAGMGVFEQLCFGPYPPLGLT
ncbi:MAG TPA: hypothetical protein VN805_02330 [Caulobacteraceae bacterium]|nr:hypothetical protein [Caulobacteraceae bacterium]